MDSPSDLPSQLDYPAIIMEQPLEEEGTSIDGFFPLRLEIRYQFKYFLFAVFWACHILMLFFAIDFSGR